VALGYTLSADDFKVAQANVAVVGAAGTWDASNCWLFSLQARDSELGSITTLATATYDQAGAGLVRLPVPSPDQDVDGSVTPEMVVAVEPLGDPPNLLRATGSLALQKDVMGTWVAQGGTTPELPPLLGPGIEKLSPGAVGQAQAIFSTSRCRSPGVPWV